MIQFHYYGNEKNEKNENANKRSFECVEWMPQGRFSDGISIGNKCERENHQRSPFDIYTIEFFEHF